jgi:uncharacterized protein YciI
MFLVLLRYSANKAEAARFMEGHNAWIQRGLDDRVFLVVGRLQPNAGGAILAHGVSRPALEARVNEDPFVAENVVKAEVLEIEPGRADERLRFLVD